MPLATPDARLRRSHPRRTSIGTTDPRGRWPLELNPLWNANDFGRNVTEEEPRVNALSQARVIGNDSQRESSQQAAVSLIFVLAATKFSMLSSSNRSFVKNAQ
jgi:hypothetical protein